MVASDREFGERKRGEGAQDYSTRDESINAKVELVQGERERSGGEVRTPVANSGDLKVGSLQQSGGVSTANMSNVNLESVVLHEVDKSFQKPVWAGGHESESVGQDPSDGSS